MFECRHFIHRVLFYNFIYAAAANFIMMTTTTTMMMIMTTIRLSTMVVRSLIKGH